MRYVRRPERFPLLLVLATAALAACGDTPDPTQPETSGDPATSLPTSALVNSWAPKAPAPFTADIFGYNLGTAANAAGQSIVYTFGGTSSDENLIGLSVRAYNVATNTWSSRVTRVHVFSSNGVAKIGTKLYFSGGYNGT